MRDSRHAHRAFVAAVCACGKHELERLADLTTVYWRVLPVTDAPDDVVDKIMKTLAA